MNAIGALLSHTRILIYQLVERGDCGSCEACNAILLASLLRGLNCAEILDIVQGTRSAQEGVTFENLVVAIESIEVPTTGNAVTEKICRTCRLVDFLDPIIARAQEYLHLKREKFWTP